MLSRNAKQLRIIQERIPKTMAAVKAGKKIYAEAGLYGTCGVIALPVGQSLCVALRLL